MLLAICSTSSWTMEEAGRARRITTLDSTSHTVSSSSSLANQAPDSSLGRLTRRALLLPSAMTSSKRMSGMWSPKRFRAN